MLNHLSKADLERIVTHPFYCVNIDPALCTEHVPLMSEQEWIGSALIVIRRFGLRRYLHELLENLKGVTLPPGAHVEAHIEPAAPAIPIRGHDLEVK